MFTDIKKVSVVPQTILEQNPSPKGNNLQDPSIQTSECIK